MADSILLIDDDVALLQTLGRFFERLGWDVYRELTGEAGLATYGRSLPDVVLVDLHLPGMDGLDVLAKLRGEEAAVLLLTGDEHLPSAVQAMREGAENFLTKPIDLEHLQVVAEHAAEKVRLKRVNRTLIGRGASSEGLNSLGTSPVMVELRQRITALARSDTPAILIGGETGSGKRTIARLIHDLSLRSSEPFIECLLTSSDEASLTSMLFGMEGSAEGSGTDQARIGLLDTADRGSLLLHHIASSPLPVQARLEETLEREAFRRSGGVREIPVGFRLIATSSIDLDRALADDQLYPALYYRLKAMEVVVPPLRDYSRKDLASAVHRTMGQLGPGLAGVPVKISDAALERMANHPWPGNFRELRHVLDRAILLARGEDEIGLGHLPAEFRDRPGPFDRRHTPLTMEEVERMHIERTLRHHAGNRTRSADELGISRATLIAKIKKYAIPL